MASPKVGDRPQRPVSGIIIPHFANWPRITNLFGDPCSTPPVRYDVSAEPPSIP